MILITFALFSVVCVAYVRLCTVALLYITIALRLCTADVLAQSHNRSFTLIVDRTRGTSFSVPVPWQLDHRDYWLVKLAEWCLTINLFKANINTQTVGVHFWNYDFFPNTRIYIVPSNLLSCLIHREQHMFKLNIHVCIDRFYPNKWFMLNNVYFLMLPSHDNFDLFECTQK